MFIVIACVICGGESWNDMETFGKAKEDWLRTFLRLPEGIPSHDTFNYVFSALNPKELELSFISWTRSVMNLTENEVICIDGKMMLGTREYGSKSIVHMVSASASVNHIVLGQIKGDVVTIDARGYQKEIASAIIEKEADYLLTLKGNQENLQKEVEDNFRFLPIESVPEEVDMGHGRIEKRQCSVISDLLLIEKKEEWKNFEFLSPMTPCTILP